MPLSPGSVFWRRLPPVSALRRHHWGFGLLMLCLSLSVAAQDSVVRSSLSASSITRDESVTLEIVAIGLDAELDVSSLEKDFEVVGRSSSRELSRVSTITGGTKTTSIVTWALELIPRDVGVFTVPGVKVGEASSQAHTLTVTDLPSGAQRDIFVEAVVDTDTPWVQAQVLLTLRVFQAVDIVDGGLDTPTGQHLVVERLGEDTRTIEERDGRSYSVTERRFAVFAQRSGQLTIDPVKLSVSVPADAGRSRGFFAPTRKITRRTDPIELTVRARPASLAGASQSWWLPAKRVTLASEWVGDVGGAEVDQPLTRTITLRASGVQDSQLPEISIPAISGASLYADQPVRQMGMNEQGLVAEQRIKWALIPQQPGELHLPAVAIEWFDTATGTLQTARLPEETVSVLPKSGNAGGSASELPPRRQEPVDTSAEAPGEASSLPGEPVERPAPGATPALSTETPSSNTLTQEAGAIDSRQLLELEESLARWRTLAVILGLLLAASAWMVYTQRKVRVVAGQASSSGRASSGEAVSSSRKFARLKNLQQLIASSGVDDLGHLQRALLAWAAEQWPQDAPATLDELSERLNPDAARLIRDLQSALYGRSSDREQLLLAIQSLPEHLKRSVARQSEQHSQRESQRRFGLPEL